MAEEETENEKQRQAKLFVEVAMTADTSRLDDEIRQRYCMSLNGCHRCLISTPILPTGRTYGDCRKEVLNRLMGKNIPFPQETNPSQMTLDEAIAHAKEMANETPCGRIRGMKKYTVVFKETRVCEMQGVEAQSAKEAKQRADEIMSVCGHENWTTQDLKIVKCFIEKGDKQ